MMLQFNTTFNGANRKAIDNDDINKIIYDTSCFLPHFKEIYESKLRYYDIKSGRGGAKTSQIAKTILKESFLPELKNTNFACGREFATNLDETSYNTLQIHVNHNNWQKYFRFIPSRKRIHNKVNNVNIYFMGCQNPNHFTSIPNLSRIWLDEISNLDRFSIERIFKSVRGSITGDRAYDTKIYCTYNPVTHLDPISSYLNERVRGKMGISAHKNIFDLPLEWQDKDLLAEAEIDKANDIDLYNWIWLGMPRPDIQENLFENVIYLEQNISPKTPVFAFMDPSFAGGDTTAISLLWVNGIKLCVTGYTFKNAWYELDDQILELYKRFNIVQFYYESNALANTISNHYYLKYGKILTPEFTKRNKVEKIYKLGYFLKRMEFFKPPSIFNNGNYSNQWCKQITQYNRLISTRPKKNEHDDAPDSLASLFDVKKYFV